MTENNKNILLQKKVFIEEHSEYIFEPHSNNSYNDLREFVSLHYNEVYDDFMLEMASHYN